MNILRNQRLNQPLSLRETERFSRTKCLEQKNISRMVVVDLRNRIQGKIRQLISSIVEGPY